MLSLFACGPADSRFLKETSSAEKAIFALDDLAFQFSVARQVYQVLEKESRHFRQDFRENFPKEQIITLLLTVGKVVGIRRIGFIGCFFHMAFARKRLTGHVAFEFGVARSAQSYTAIPLTAALSIIVACKILKMILRVSLHVISLPLVLLQD